MQRYQSLDWLRGLMAFSIMSYHLILWTLYPPQAGSLLGNFGIYGVSIFFVLSGLSMAIVYHSYIKDFISSTTFFIRRLFRILPLLWVVVVAMSLVAYFFGGTIDITKILLNLTLLFGFIAPEEYYSAGMWSIGNEAVYYAFTPLLILIYAKSKLLGNIVVAVTVFIGMYFGFVLLDETKQLSAQFATSYINPFNNFFLYTCGLALYYNFHNVNFSKISTYLLIIIPLLIFTFYPVSGDQIVIVTDNNRIIFALSAIMLTLGFYKLNINVPNFISKPLANLGEATYGVYLLHPLVFIIVNKIFKGYPVMVIFGSILATIIAANISYRFYETPFIKLGKKTTQMLEDKQKKLN